MTKQNHCMDKFISTVHLEVRSTISTISYQTLFVLKGTLLTLPHPDMFAFVKQYLLVFIVFIYSNSFVVFL